MYQFITKSIIYNKQRAFNKATSLSTATPQIPNNKYNTTPQQPYFILIKIYNLKSDQLASQMKTNHYLQHLQNTSPAKTTYTFSKGSRFSKINIQTPNKFYDFPMLKSRRCTSLGYGKKVDFINKALWDPGLYQTKGEFEEMKAKVKKSLKSTFGQSHTNIFERKLNSSRTPGPGEYRPENYKDRTRFHMGIKTPTPKSLNSTLKLGPQTYSIQNCVQKISKFKAARSFRIKTQISTASKTKLLELYPLIPGPGAYNPEKLTSLEELAKTKGITGAASFSKSKRVKTEAPKPIGPGSYSSFSVFSDCK